MQEESRLRSLRSNSQIQSTMVPIIDHKYDKADPNVNSASFCCLCFRDVDTDQGYNLKEDNIIYPGRDPLKMIDILCYVLGDQFLTDICLLTSSTLVCQPCGQDAARSYKFIKQCKHNYEMRSTGETVNSCLDVQIKVEDNSQAVEENNFAVEVVKEEKTYDTNDDDYEPDNVKKNKKGKSKKKRAKKLNLNRILHDTSTAEEYKCKLCLKEFPRPKNLRNHYIRVHAPKTFKCPDCPLSYGSKLYLHVHRKLNHKQVVCSQCGKGFTNIHTMRRHEKNHVVTYTCGHCDKEYRTKQALKHHIKTLCSLSPILQIGKQKEEFPCEHCSKKYSKKDSLQEHIRFKHKNGKCYTCTWCNKKLNNFSRLQEHIVVHTKDKKFSCNMCGGKFVNKSSLLYHTRIHTGDKPYKCDYCEERFINTSRRTKHVKSRHSDKLECDICLITFTCQSSLVKHRLKHPEAKLDKIEAKSSNDKEDASMPHCVTEYVEITIKEEVKDFDEGNDEFV